MNETSQEEEQLASIRPRIYVADLAAYNNGELHGAWIEAHQDEDEIWAEIQTLLNASPVPGSEEIAVHDYEGFGPLDIGEFESIRTIASIAAAMAEHGDAMAMWIDYLGHDGIENAVDTFEDAYLGAWTSMHAFAEHIVEDMGVEIEVRPESWAHYVRFDTQALARDLDVELHSERDPDGELHIFTPTALR